VTQVSAEPAGAPRRRRGLRQRKERDGPIA